MSSLIISYCKVVQDTRWEPELTGCRSVMTTIAALCSPTTSWRIEPTMETDRAWCRATRGPLVALPTWRQRAPLAPPPGAAAGHMKESVQALLTVTEQGTHSPPRARRGRSGARAPWWQRQQPLLPASLPAGAPQRAPDACTGAHEEQGCGCHAQHVHVATSDHR